MMMTKFFRILVLVLVLGQTNAFANGFDWCFVKNNGQFQKQVNFSHAIPNGTVFLENDKITYHLFDAEAYHEAFEHQNKLAAIQHHAFEVSFVGAKTPQIEQSQKTNHYFNFFIGEDETNWAAKIYGHHQVNYLNLYKGIDFVIYDKEDQIKYDFIVKAGANPNQIKLKYDGLDQIYIDDSGRLHLSNTVGEIIEDKPFVYQIINGKQIEIPAQYKLNKNVLSFSFPEGYNKKHDLFVDPTLIFSSYSGSTNLYTANCSAFDQAGNLYSAGGSLFGGYPTTIGAYQTAFVGGGLLGAIQKFDQAGNMLYATYLGGDNDYPLDAMVNQNDELVVLVNTNGSFPITAGAASNAFNGGNQDYAIGILNNAGTALVASTYLGGTGDEGIGNSDIGAGIYVDANNDIFVSGMTQSIDFPATAGAYQVAQPGNESGTVTKLNAGLTTIIWSTYLGGTAGDDVANSVTVAPNGDVYIIGSTTSADFPTTAGALNTISQGLRDGFVACLTPNGTALNFSTFIGTNDVDRGKFIEINANNEVFVGGSTRGNYPISAGVFSSPSTNNLFVHKLSTDLSTSLFSTAIGCLDVAQPEIYMTAFGIDYCDKIYFTGASTGNNFPTTADAYTTAEKGLYMCVLEPDATALFYGSYFGGNVNGQHFHVGSKCKYNREGILFHTECTTATDYPLVNGLNSIAGGLNDGASFIFDFEFSQPITQIDLGPDLNVCTFPVNLDAALATNVNVRYLWSTTETTENIDVNAAGTYSVQVYNSCDTIYDTIIVNLASVSASFTVDQIDKCLNETFVFTDQTAPTANQTWLWNFGDGNTSIDQNPTHAYEAPGIYSVSLTVSANGCSDVTIQNVEVHDIPTADFEFSPEFLTIDNSEINFENTSIGADTYIWNFGLAFGSSILPNPTFVFPEDADMTYPIILEASNIHGCTHEVTKYLEFQDIVVFYVPNAFTPGSSGPNSTFSPVMTSGVEPYQYHLILYDRWGEIVFESFNYDIGWDGTYANHIAQAGVYIWKIEFRETMTDKKHTETGHLTVLR